MVGVLKIRKGDSVRFFDGVGGIFESTIAHINKDGVLATITSKTSEARGPEINLAIAVLKNDRMRFAIEKATELGVHSIIPIITERVVKRPEIVPTRWKIIAKEAAEQSGRAWLPTIANIMPFKNAVDELPNKLICSTGAQIRVCDAPAATPLTIFIGPEGGFTDNEIAYAALKEATAVSLGNHQLRADTASTVALAQILSHKNIFV
jgi:16S rRNA (uracil1498-N3)-methyltransferase